MKTARENGWRGFDSAGQKVPGGWLYICDGMPRIMGCGQDILITRQWTRVGTKKVSRWLVVYGMEPDTENAPFDDPTQWHEDHDIVLTFCPSCAEVVRGQDKAREFA